MDHPQAVIEKAQRLEQLLLRLEAGEAFEPTCTALELRVKEKDIPRLQAKYEAGGRKWEALIDGREAESPKPEATVEEKAEPPEPETTVEGRAESVEHAGLFFPGGGKARDGGGG
jgi:hypothetical protein